MSKYRNFLLVILTLIVGQQAFAQQSEATQRLLERNSMFEPEIIQVANNVYTSIGYQVSTNSMIVGDDGVIIIDPGQQVTAARSVRAEFEKISSKPIRAIIYTHSHADHVNGTPAFVDQNEDIEIWASCLRYFPR